MSVHSHDWFSLVNLSGLIVSEPVLIDCFPDGPPALTRQAETAFRREYTRWVGASHADDVQHHWISFVLEDLLGHGPQAFHRGMAISHKLIIELADYEQRLYPSRVLVDAGGKPQLLVVIAPAGQDLDRKETETGKWRASPFTKITRLLRETRVPLGLLTNGDEWRLVYAEQPTTAHIQWSAQGWSDDRLTLRAFLMLLGAERFDPRTPEALRLIGLIHESQERQIDVADQLGDQVRAAIRIFVRALDALDREQQGALLADIAPGEIYEMAILFMMRLVFLLYAEEHKLLPHGEVLYDQAYGLTYLWTRLQRQRRERRETLDTTHDAWMQLLAVFNLVYYGVEHPDFNTPAYGGGLFDPDRFPVLRQAHLSNTVIADILHRLLMAESTFGGERIVQRVSYRSLDVEQFGYMYEGLLDHVVMRAGEPMLALAGVKHKDPVLPVRELEQEAQAGRQALIGYLAGHSGRSENALNNMLDAADSASDDDLSRLWDVSAPDEDLYNRARPYLYLLDAGRGVDPVISVGTLYIGDGPTRRATGTHYTPISLTEPIVRHTLEPLVTVGPAEGLPPEQWKLRSARELLDLKVCDMAMGSGAFLVQACRYLADKLVEAWSLAEHARKVEIKITPYGERAKGNPGELIIPDDAEARVTLARRLAADRCLYGVDKNPLAVDIARLSLWLITMDRQRPFTFLDHALKSGDSLVGVSLEQLQAWDLSPKDKTPKFGTLRLQEAIEAVIDRRRQIANLPVMNVEDQHHKEDLLTQAEALTNDLREAADLLVSSYFNDLNAADQQAIRDALLDVVQQGRDVPGDFAVVCDLGDLRPFHWEMEYPEVFERRGGFDAFVGNPPFMGGQKITGALSVPYRQYLVNHLAEGKRGSADLCAYFFLRAYGGLCPGGNFGLIATNTIAQGDTREVGLDTIVQQGGTIFHAANNYPWPGAAAVSVNIVHNHKGSYAGQCVLDGQPVMLITPMLDAMETRGKPYRLRFNTGTSFQGSNVLGMGFVLTPEEAQVLIDKDTCNADVLLPYLIGEDLNSRPDQSPSRWVINFFDWPLERAEQYPDCMQIVRDKVYPERQKNNSRQRREIWWRFTRPTIELYETIAPLSRVLVAAQTSKYLSMGFQPTGIVYSHMTVVIATDKSCDFAVLNTSFHGDWVRKYASTLETRMRYLPSDCFETYPFPLSLEPLESVGEAYHEHRRQIMLDRWEGLTATYNRFHRPAETAEDIAQLRELHVEMDYAVAAAYGWSDLDLGHGFHETAQGVRYTISEAARREVLTRLLALNHQRHAEEVEAGVIGGKKGKGKKRQPDEGSPRKGGSQTRPYDPGVSDGPQQLGLFGEEEEF